MLRTLFAPPAPMTRRAVGWSAGDLYWQQIGGGSAMAHLPTGGYLLVEAYGDDYIGQLYDDQDRLVYPPNPSRSPEDGSFSPPSPDEIITKADFDQGCREFLGRSGWDR